MECFCGKESNMARHVSSDWLVACWLIFWACLFVTFICWIAIFTAANSRQMFVYISTFFDMLLYLISSMYFVAGSYSHTQDNTHKDYDEEAQNDVTELMLLETVENPLVGMYSVFTGGTPRSPRSPRTSQKAEYERRYSSEEEQLQHEVEVNNLLNKYTKGNSNNTVNPSANNTYSPVENDNELYPKTPVKTTRFGAAYNAITTEPLYTTTATTKPPTAKSNSHQYVPSHVPPLRIPGESQQPTGVVAAVAVHPPQQPLSDRSQTSAAGSETSDKSNMSSSKVTSRVRVSKFRNIFSNPVKTEQIYSNIRVANITGDQNFIRANHLFFAIPIEVSNYIFIYIG